MFYCDNLKIRDKYGRERIFRGINFCIKEHKASKNLVRRRLLRKKVFKDMKSVGVNMKDQFLFWRLYSLSAFVFHIETIGKRKHNAFIFQNNGINFS